MQQRKTLHERALAESGRDLTIQEQTQFDAWGAEVQSLANQIRRAEALAPEALELAATTGRLTDLDAASPLRLTAAAGWRTQPASPIALSAADTGGFLHTGDFLKAIYDLRTAGKHDTRLDACAERARQLAMGSNDSGGGFAVPTQFVYAAFDEVSQSEPLLSQCDRIEMRSPQVDLPVFRDTTHATSPYGIAWHKHSEGATESAIGTPEIEARSLHAHTWFGLFRCSNEWLADAYPQMRTRLNDAFLKSLRWKVENLLWTGNGGAAEPQGVIDSAATLEIDAEVGQAASTVITENVLRMWARLLPGSHERAFWACNPTCFRQLATLSVDIGAAGDVVGLLRYAGTGIAGQPATSMLGRPLFMIEHLPALGTSGDLMLVDPSLYVLGQRQGVVLDMDTSRYFDANQTAFRCTTRFDAVPALRSAFTPYAGDTQAFALKIATRS
ncbi:MAG: phage major capsid protein [Planctomycetes bacterium]|nr:phage major capsid protein [Planctomycetota bacterium]